MAELNAPYILMLEDDVEDRYITQSFFDEKGYDIRLEFMTYPGDVLEFLSHRLVTSAPLPHLIILDKNVPAGDGLEVLKEIKAHLSFRAIPVIIISGTAFPEIVSEAYRAGASSYIVKPLTDKQTKEKIEAFIQYWFEIVELPAAAGTAATLPA